MKRDSTGAKMLMVVMAMGGVLCTHSAGAAPVLPGFQAARWVRYCNS